METILSIALGLGLSAACGFRVFVPLLVLSAASRIGWVTLGSGWEWIDSTPALVMFGVAAGLEVLAYLVPWLDNLLDTLATPAAVIAGIIASAALIVDLDPLLGWTVAIIGGGSAAGITQAATTVLRGLSTGTTGGVMNPLVSLGEAVASLALSLTAVLVPIAAVIGVLCFIILAAYGVRRRRRRNRVN